MIIVKESQKLEEMAIRVISGDDLPFRIAVKAPDHLPHHAHVMDKVTGKKELGQFLVDQYPPKRPADIKDYKQGIPDEMRRLIFKWANFPSKIALGKLTNWEMLNIECRLNDKQ
jgi:hypothetical protein